MVGYILQSNEGKYKRMKGKYDRMNIRLKGEYERMNEDLNVSEYVWWHMIFHYYFIPDKRDFEKLIAKTRGVWF